MKNLLLLLSLFLVTPAYADQYVNANLGVGTTATSARLVVIGGNVGIGSLTPGQVLDVQGTVRVLNNGNVQIKNGNLGIGTTQVTNSALTIMNGNMGIGTWIPTKAIDIVNGADGAEDIKIALNNLNTSAGSASAIVFTNTSVVPFAASNNGGSKITAVRQPSGGNAIVFYNSDGATNFPANMSIINGNVGLGTLLPQSIIETRNDTSTSVIRWDNESTSGTTIISATGPNTKTPGLTVRNGTTDILSLIASRTGTPPFTGIGGAGEGGVGTNGNFNFYTFSNNIARSVFQGDGNIGLGTVRADNKLVIFPCAAYANLVACYSTNGAAGRCTGNVSGTGCTCTAC